MRKTHREMQNMDRVTKKIQQSSKYRGKLDDRSGDVAWASDGDTVPRTKAAKKAAGLTKGKNAKLQVSAGRFSTSSSSAKTTSRLKH